MRYIALAAICCASAFTAETRLLFDFRSAPSRRAAPSLPRDAEQRVLSAVFPQFLTSARDCRTDSLPPDAAHLKAARHAGQIAPRIQDSAAGSFTRARGRQMAFLIQTGECGAEDRTYWGSWRLAIFEQQRLAAVAESRGDAIAATADVNGDGIDELLISGCGFGQGTLDCTASLISMAGGQAQQIHDFGNVYEDPCGGSPELRISAAVLRFIPAATPRFLREEFEAACPQSRQSPQFRPAANK